MNSRPHRRFRRRVLESSDESSASSVPSPDNAFLFISTANLTPLHTPPSLAVSQLESLHATLSRRLHTLCTRYALSISPSEKSEMSVDAKRSLYAKERGLDFDGQKRVASLLARRLGEPALACGGTVEVDVDAIGDATLWEIRAIVDQLDGTDKADEKGVEEGVVRAAGRDVEEVERALVRLMYVVNDGVPSRREGRAPAKKQYRKTGQH